MAGKKNKCKKQTRKGHVSSGLKFQRTAKRIVKSLERKIARWKRYQTDPTRSEKRSWNTNGLERHMTLMLKMAKRPAKRPKQSIVNSSSLLN